MYSREEIHDDPHKFCRGCKTNQPIYQFGKNKRTTDGYDYRCKACKAQEVLRYINSEKGKRTRQEYYKQNKSKHMANKRIKRAEYDEKNPEKVQARMLLRNAVRKGYIPKPEGSDTWYNRWEFHHPDHTRPYYGVWLRTPDHRNVDYGNMECPPCTDYTDIVRERVLADWALLSLLKED